MTLHRVLSVYFLITISFTASLEGQINTVRYSVGRVGFEGNSTISSRQLKKVIKLEEPGFFSSMEFNRRSLKLDALKIRNSYQSQGFLAASVEESFEINSNNSVDILFTIHEGERSYLRSVTVRGNDSLSEKKIYRILGLRNGSPFDLVGLRQRIADLEREYGKLGRLYFTIDPSFVPGEDIDLQITIHEGPPVRIDNLVIQGLDQIDSIFVSREIALKSGDIFNQELVELSERRIFETGLFSMVNIRPQRVQEARNGSMW